MIKCTELERESRYSICMEHAVEAVTPMEAMARKLADMAGVNWNDLRDYPGYERNQWRHEAEVLIRKMEWTRYA